LIDISKQPCLFSHHESRAREREKERERERPDEFVGDGGVEPHAADARSPRTGQRQRNKLIIAVIGLQIYLVKGAHHHGEGECADHRVEQSRSDVGIPPLAYAFITGWVPSIQFLPTISMMPDDRTW
jgi:hypothetical protein